MGVVEELGLEALATGPYFHWPGDNLIKTPGLDKNSSESSYRLFIAPPIGQALSYLLQNGIEAYIVGGFIRDFLLEREAEDIDLAVKADSKKATEELSGLLGGKVVLLDVERNIYRLVLTGEEKQQKIDLSSIEGDIYRDLAERDFTINAIALPIKSYDLSEKTISGKLIDPFNGQADIKSHIIRALNDGIFAKDPARLVRAFRLAAELNFDIEEKTELIIQKNSHLVRNAATERVREDFMGILARRGAEGRLKKMDSLGLLDALFPELAFAKGVAQPGWHVYDVFDHSLQTLHEVEHLLQSEPQERKANPLLSMLPWDEEVEKHFKEEIASGSPRLALNKLAGLLHDISKPQTKTLTPDGHAHFYGHTRRGAEVSRAIMERMRFSNREIELVEIIVGNHLRPTQMVDMSGDDKLAQPSRPWRPTNKAIYRFFRDAKDASLDILYLSLADYLASKGKEVDRKEWQENVDLIQYILKVHKEMQAVTKPPRLVNGHEMMKAFSLSPGPLIGELLDKVEESRALGKISTKEEALSLVEKLLKERKRVR